MKLSKDEVKFSPLVDSIVEGMEEVKGQNITVFNLSEIENSVCDFFVVCDGTSNTQVNALSDSIEKTVRESLGDKPWHVEGRDNSEWVLLDYVNVVAHVFQKSVREFYDLDSLWSDAEVTVLENKY
ncbi:MAG TPA: ribosome silencing factor [Cryomorphaceae bacterium]|nr:ribosome silencing factor [Owenweeksia sp.]HAD96110.1 ribosome silencing factor [Cryomorphaceae bacterium]HCQ16385.1 ribosome silencing factor [Cryomorphaceae bacterium]|tara:strand:- start:197 stop:574 length:378 start_codon:yes stop_codon:yes gene_type:complete